jgi:sugar (pentulose or hexulose) kinase
VGHWHQGRRREHLFRAIMEGIGDEFRLAMEGIQMATGERIDGYVVLGGSGSELWCQIMADVLGAIVTRAIQPQHQRLAELTGFGRQAP